MRPADCQGRNSIGRPRVLGLRDGPPSSPGRWGAVIPGCRVDGQAARVPQTGWKMKTFALCVVCGGLAFAVVQYQMTGQLFGFGLGHSTQTPPPPGAKFPETLAVAC